LVTKLPREERNIVNLLNKFFLEAANITNEQTNKYVEIDRRPMDYLYTSFLQEFQKLVLKKTNSKEIEEIIRSIKPKSACGYDGITIKLIKVSTPFISSPLAYIFNKSLSTGIFPSRLKYSEIIRIHKKGDKTDMSNYRPGSFLKPLKKLCIKRCSHI
jgi:hypothetical protein